MINLTRIVPSNSVFHRNCICLYLLFFSDLEGEVNSETTEATTGKLKNKYQKILQGLFCCTWLLPNWIVIYSVFIYL